MNGGFFGHFEIRAVRLLAKVTSSLTDCSTGSRIQPPPTPGHHLTHGVADRKLKGPLSGRPFSQRPWDDAAAAAPAAGTRTPLMTSGSSGAARNFLPLGAHMVFHSAATATYNSPSLKKAPAEGRLAGRPGRSCRVDAFAVRWTSKAVPTLAPSLTTARKRTSLRVISLLLFPVLILCCNLLFYLALRIFELNTTM